jgi:hypothetical protein
MTGAKQFAIHRRADGYRRMCIENTGQKIVSSGADVNDDEDIRGKIARQILA